MVLGGGREGASVCSFTTSMIYFCDVYWHTCVVVGLGEADLAADEGLCTCWQVFVFFATKCGPLELVVVSLVKLAGSTLLPTTQSVFHPECYSRPSIPLMAASVRLHSVVLSNFLRGCIFRHAAERCPSLSNTAECKMNTVELTGCLVCLC